MFGEVTRISFFFPQVFSVRLRDRGPDYRGFVQLPLVQDQDGNPASVVDPVVLAQVTNISVSMSAG